MTLNLLKLYVKLTSERVMLLQIIKIDFCLETG